MNGHRQLKISSTGMAIYHNLTPVEFFLTQWISGAYTLPSGHNESGQSTLLQATAITPRDASTGTLIQIGCLSRRR
ncbi:hypothetical protein AALO_G00292850 [Alosa alosa]|uniref:Uncharacterized protein n=1 Tax=Alosa alosa TaxID=278164 RepID=A0AAV6FK39_9TELE|nr:hypothetical protein AALO_G00292850 [Alosa alosa]